MKKNWKLKHNKKSKVKNNSAITLVVLVVTMIVMLIFAGVSFTIIFGDDAIFKNANSAALEQEKTEETDTLAIAYAPLYSSEIILSNDKVTPEKLQKEIEINGKDSEVHWYDNNEKSDELLVTFKKTKNIYKINIYDGHVEYIGTGDRDYSSSTIINAKVTIVNVPNKWTNQDVYTTITVTDEDNSSGYILEYSINSLKDWKEYTEPLVSEANRMIYVRLRNMLTEECVYLSTDISFIDKINPTVAFGTNGGNYVVDTGKGKATVKTKVTVTDPQIKNSVGANVAGSGVFDNELKYAWSESNTTEPTSWTAFTNETEISKTDCAYGRTYYLWIQYNDLARHNADVGVLVTKSNAFTIGTEAQTNITLATTWDANASNTAKVDITGAYTGSTLQYQVNGISGKWITGNTVTVTGGLATEGSVRRVYGRLYDGINSHYASVLVKDTTAPSMTLSSSNTANWLQKVTLTGKATDSESLVTNWDWAQTASTARYGNTTANIEKVDKTVVKGVRDTGNQTNEVTTNGTYYF